MNKSCGNYGSSWCCDFECGDCPVNTVSGTANEPENLIEQVVKIISHSGSHQNEYTKAHAINLAYTVKWGSLIDNLFTALEHADFSNGNVVQFVDEGSGTASRYIEECKAEYKKLKEC